MKRPWHDTPQKRLLRELRERGAIPVEEIHARGHYIGRAFQALCREAQAREAGGMARLTAKGIAHATQI